MNFTTFYEELSKVDGKSGISLTIRSNNDFSFVEMREDARLQPLINGQTDAGAPYISAIKNHIGFLAENYFNAALGGNNISVIGVPRGGTPVGEEVARIIAKSFPQREVHSFQSQEKFNRDELYPPEFDFAKTETLILADGIVGEGGTMLRHLSQIPALWDGEIHIVSNISAERGMKNIRSFIERNGLTASFMTGALYPEDECAHVDVGGGKIVYFVGTSENIPDFGDHVSGGLENPSCT